MHNSHYHDNCYTSSNGKLSRNAHTPMPSNRDASTSGKSKAEENFYLNDGKILAKRRSSNVPSHSSSCKSSPTARPN
jgi:hypothetical protein